jgi:hypothetical protein
MNVVIRAVAAFSIMRLARESVPSLNNSPFYTEGAATVNATLGLCDLRVMRPSATANAALNLADCSKLPSPAYRPACQSA